VSDDHNDLSKKVESEKRWKRADLDEMLGLVTARELWWLCIVKLRAEMHREKYPGKTPFLRLEFRDSGGSMDMFWISGISQPYPLEPELADQFYAGASE
jgi:hypothetical protein